MKHGPKGKMDEARFRALAEAYGSHLARWPSDERRAAEALLARSTEANRWLAEQRQIDLLLDGAPDMDPSAALLRRVAEIPLRHQTARDVRAWWPFLRLRNLLAVGAAAAALGAALGMVTPESAPVADAEATWDELSALAWGIDLSEELSP